MDTEKNSTVKSRIAGYFKALPKRYFITAFSGMAQGFSQNSTQASVMYNIDTVQGGTSVALTDKDGKVLAAFTPEKQYTNVVISAGGLTVGNDYIIQIGGAVSGADQNGFAISGTVTNAQKQYEFTLSSTATSNGQSGMGGIGGHGGGMGGKPRF